MARYAGTMAGDRWARARSGRRRILCLGYRNEARRYPRARCRVLRDTAALERFLMLAALPTKRKIAIAAVLIAGGG